MDCGGARFIAKLVHEEKRSLKYRSCDHFISKGRVATIRYISKGINSCGNFSLNSNKWSGWKGLNVEYYIVVYRGKQGRP